MRALLSIAALGIFASVANSQNAAGPQVRVTGIVCFGSRTNAVVEIQPTRGGLLRPILRPGEKIEGVEVVSIDPSQGLVVVKSDELNSAFRIEGTPAGVASPTFNLRGADSRQVLEVYQELSGRTVLSGGNLPSAAVDLQNAAVLPPPAAAQALETILAEKGIALSAVGEKIACAVRIGDEAAIDALPPFPAPVEPHLAEVLPPGMIKFQEADILQALEIYQELAGRSVVRAPVLRGKITVRSQTPLRRAEAVWLMVAAAQLTGTRIVPDGEKFAVAIPREKTSPVVRSNPSLVRPENEQTLPAGMIRFSGAEPAAVLAVYAELCHRKAGSSDGIPPARFFITTQTSLTTKEALHGLDLVAALHGLEFVPVDEDKISVRPRLAGADTAPVPK